MSGGLGSVLEGAVVAALKQPSYLTPATFHYNFTSLFLFPQPRAEIVSFV